MRLDLSGKGLPLEPFQPPIGIHVLRNTRKLRIIRTRHARGLIATGAGLIGALLVVVKHKALGDLSHLLERAGTMHEQAFMTQCASDRVRRMRSYQADAGDRHGVRRPNTTESAPDAIRKSRPLALPTKRGSLSKVSMAGKPCSSAKLGHRLQKRFGMEIGMSHPFEPDRGACVHKISHFDHMLLLALRISRNGHGIFEIQLHFLAWVFEVLWSALAAVVEGDTPMGSQNLPHGSL